MERTEVLSLERLSKLLIDFRKENQKIYLVFIGVRFSYKHSTGRLHFEQLKQSNVFDKVLFLYSFDALKDARGLSKDSDSCVLVLSNKFQGTQIGVFENSKEIHTRPIVVNSTVKHPLTGELKVINSVSDYVTMLNISVQNLLLKNFVPEPSKVNRPGEETARPWGTISVLSEHDITSVRVLNIQPNSRLSFQRHVCRDELFISQSKNVLLDIYFKDFTGDLLENKKDVITKVLNYGDSFFVKRGTWHRLKSNDKSATILEVGYGPYDQENDIERKYDDYGRKGKNGAV